MNDKEIKTTSTKVVTPPTPTIGQIYSKPDIRGGHSYYMVCQVKPFMYCLIDLSDGNRWRDPEQMWEFNVMIKEDDFEYVADNLTSFTATSRSYTEREMSVVV